MNACQCTLIGSQACNNCSNGTYNQPNQNWVVWDDYRTVPYIPAPVFPTYDIVEEIVEEYDDQGRLIKKTIKKYKKEVQYPFTITYTT